MKKVIYALLAISMTIGLTLGAPPASAEEPKTLEEKWRHNSPLTAAVLLNPLGIAAFAIDVPIYIVARKQPMTYAMTQMELVDGYNPMTSESSAEETERHQVMVTDSY
jgi:hypothetical protein